MIASRGSADFPVGVPRMDSLQDSFLNQQVQSSLNGQVSWQPASSSDWFAPGPVSKSSQNTESEAWGGQRPNSSPEHASSQSTGSGDTMQVPASESTQGSMKTPQYCHAGAVLSTEQAHWQPVSRIPSSNTDRRDSSYSVPVQGGFPGVPMPSSEGEFPLGLQSSGGAHLSQAYDHEDLEGCESEAGEFPLPLNDAKKSPKSSRSSESSGPVDHDSIAHSGKSIRSGDSTSQLPPRSSNAFRYLPPTLPN